MKSIVRIKQCFRKLAGAESNAAFGQIVRGDLNGNFVAG